MYLFHANQYVVMWQVRINLDLNDRRVQSLSRWVPADTKLRAQRWVQTKKIKIDFTFHWSLVSVHYVGLSDGFSERLIQKVKSPIVVQIQLYRPLSWLSSMKWHHDINVNINMVTAECHAETVISSLAVVVTISSIHCTYPWRAGQAKLAWDQGGSSNTKTVYQYHT